MGTKRVACTDIYYMWVYEGSTCRDRCSTCSESERVKWFSRCTERVNRFSMHVLGGLMGSAITERVQWFSMYWEGHLVQHVLGGLNSSACTGRVIWFNIYWKG